MKQIFIILTLLFTFLGCSKDIPTSQERLHVAHTIAKQNTLHVKVFKTKKFDIYAQYNKLTCKDIHVYIEGDGLSWITSSTISDNPTPLNPLALKLMVQDDFTCKIYLARPCQYTQNLTCREKYWTSHRFSQEVIDSYNEVLDGFKGVSFKLFGYSGGGAIATLLSAQRKDIKELVTIAGNLDIEYWTKKHSLTPLSGSLNPALFSENLLHVKQVHLIGGKDKIIDQSVYDSYIRHFRDKSNIKYKISKNFTHSCCWEKEWKDILKYISKYD
jgi:hypothetical protein